MKLKMRSKSETEISSVNDRIRSFALVIAVCVAVCVSVCFAVSSFCGRQRLCEIELQGFINPNTATASSLVRLPGIGPVRAESIVAYRESWAQQKGRTKAFYDCSDLQKVKGIGPKTVQNISEWMRFE